MRLVSGAGGGARSDDRGVSGGPAEPQLERPEGCSLFEGIIFIRCETKGREAREFPFTPHFFRFYELQNQYFTLCDLSFFFCFLVSLQVEQLFCLGLRSRVECHKILEMCDWNLELASTQLLDTYGSIKQR